MSNSSFLSLNKWDFIKGAVNAFLFQLIVSLYEIIQNSISSESFEWPTATELKKAFFYALAAFGAYLVKNWLTNDEGKMMKKNQNNDN